MLTLINADLQLVSVDSRRKSASIMDRNVETSSHAGSSHRGSVETVTSKDYIDLIHRILDTDIKSRPAEDGRVNENRHDRHNRLHFPPPESPGRSRRRTPRDSDYDSAKP